MANNEDSTWNRLTNAAQRSRRILFLGSRRLPTHIEFFKDVGPVSSFTMAKLSEFLDYMESVPENWHKVALCGSKYEDLFSKMDTSDFENKEGYYTLGSIFIQKRSNIMTDEIIEHECMELLPGNTQTKIRRLKERVFNSLDIPEKFKPLKEISTHSNYCLFAIV
jgi:hypothetical protein